jgi:hypothetical protein
MNDRVINPLHLEFCVFNVGQVLRGFVSVGQKGFSSCIGPKVIFYFSLYFIFRLNLFFSLVSDRGCHPLAYLEERQVPLRGVLAPPVWNISVLFIIILGTPSVSVTNDSFKLKSISGLSIPSTFSCAFLDYHGHGRLLSSFVIRSWMMLP